MTKHTAILVPEFPGIDLSFRPRTYFGPVPLETHLLSRVAGQERREALRRELAACNLDLPPELIACLLDEEDRAAIGSIHPAFMGGEYLPPLLDDEVEIARISLASVTADQISVRAERRAEGIRYRIVDEYEETGLNYACDPDQSKLPLTLGQLVAMIDGGLPDGGAALSHLYRNAENGSGSAELRSFVRVSSEFYPQLEQHYQHRIAIWFDQNHPFDEAENQSE